MAGTILENLSGRKLAVLVTIMAICQITCFLIGGIVAPAPSYPEIVVGTKCLRNEIIHIPDFANDPWNFPRYKAKSGLYCNAINDYSEPSIEKDPNITPNKIVFAYQIPLARGGYDLDYSRWMQNLVAVLNPDIEYKPENVMDNRPTLTLLVKLGYRNKDNPENQWTLLANATIQRVMDCTIDENKRQVGYAYDCSLLPLFELGSLHHDFYLLNIAIPVTSVTGQPLNQGVGHIKDLTVVFINQNGGFTKVWVSLKASFFPVILATMVWYWRRITMLSRPSMLIERMLLALGIAVSLLNLPLEFVTLVVELPFMLLLSDIRQGIFYASLLSFWLVFCGEHLMDDVDRNRLRSYWKNLSSVACGCFCLFLFDMCERGVQLKNPFYSIWVSQMGTNLALVFIVLAGISACLYFFFLCYMVYRVFRNIGFKRSSLPSMSNTRRMFYEGIIYRFKFLMMMTLICAALTVISYILGQVSEGQWQWDDKPYIEYTSAFFTGVYGMWNIYIFALLVLYAPSHKSYPSVVDLVANSSQEEIEFSRLTTSEHATASEPTEVSSLTEFAKKAALD